LRRSGDAEFFLREDSQEDGRRESGDREGAKTIAGLGELDTVEKAIFDGRRYLGMSAPQVLSLTPREFAIEMRAHTESVYDEYERMATHAMMIRAAHHAKKLKQSQLFKRPTGEEMTKRKTVEKRERTEETMRWLSQFEEFQGKEGVIGGE